MSLFFADCEADGPCPGLYSMVEAGLVMLTPELDKTFWRDLKPMTDQYVQGALDSIGMTREKSMSFGDPKQAMVDMAEWVEATTVDRPVFISDNPGFDWQFFNYYCHYYLGRNPFGFSSRRIGDFYAGLQKNFRATSNWKKLRKTAHTHNALDDAMGNAQAFATFCRNHGIDVKGL